MTPQEWPIADSSEDRDKPARAAGPSRLRTVRVDFFLKPAERLTEQERALMTSMLRGLVGDIAAEIRAALPPGWTAVNHDDAILVDILARAGLLNHAGLMALLLRRADEERTASAAQGRSGRGDARAIQGLVSHRNSQVSASAMGVILARGRRRDRFGQPLLAFDDLPPETAQLLVYAIAAALRSGAASTNGPAAADSELARAAARLLDKHDRARGLEALTAAMVAALDEADTLDDDLILACAGEGEVGFLGEVIGRRAGISGSVALDELLSGDARQLIAILRLAGFSRPLSAALLASLGDLLGIEDAGAAIEMFDALSDADLEAAASWLAAPVDYRSFVNSLGTWNG
jgi:hypothetical protein